MNKSRFIAAFSVILSLVKYRLSLLVTFSAMTGYFLTGKPIGLRFWMLLLGVFLLAAGSSGLNQFQERNFDLLMERTKNRPIPSKRISASIALLASLFLIISGTCSLGYLGRLPLILGLTTVVFYNLIYTPLKRLTWLAIVPGAFVGAIVPLIGWTSGDSFVFHPVILFVSVFVWLWQLPHFWLLFLRFRRDYELAGFASVPCFMSNSGIKNLVFIWAVFTSCFLCSFPLYGVGFNPSIITLFGLLNLLFIILFRRLLYGNKESNSIRKAFILINLFAFLVFTVLILSV